MIDSMESISLWFIFYYYSSTSYSRIIKLFNIFSYFSSPIRISSLILATSTSNSKYALFNASNLFGAVRMISLVLLASSNVFFRDSSIFVTCY